MKHKHGSQQHGENPQQQTGDSPENPLHVKLVPGENEGAPKTDSHNERGDAKKEPPNKWRWPIWMGAPDWWIAGGTIVLAIFAIGSFALLWKQLNDAREAYIGGQRPYVWTVQEEIPTVKLGEKVAWNFHFTDFGKTPAVGVAYRCQVRLLGHKTPERSDMFEPLHRTKGLEYQGVVVPPNDTTNWSTCFSEEIVTEEDLRMMNTYDAGAKLMLYFEYFDISWNKYTSQVCWIIRRPGSGSAVAPCPAENKIN